MATRDELIKSALSKLQNKLTTFRQSAKTNIGNVGNTLNQNVRYIGSEVGSALQSPQQRANQQQLFSQIAQRTKQSYTLPFISQNSPQYQSLSAEQKLGSQAPRFLASLTGSGKLAESATTLTGLAGIGGITALGGGINKALGGSFEQGAIDTAKTLPSIYGIGAVTNPAISSFAGKASKLIDNPLGKTLLSRGASGLGNIPEGVVMSGGIGQPYGAGQAAVDFGAGVLLGPSAPQNIANNASNPYLQRNDALKETIGRLETKIRQLENNGGSKTAIKQVSKQIDAAYKQIAQNRIKANKVGLRAGIVGDSKKVEQRFNTEKFDLSNDQRKTLDELRKSLGFETRKVRSFEEMRDVAEELGTDPARLISDIQNGRITDSEVIALGNVINTSTDRITDLTKQLKADPSNSLLRKKLTQEEQLLNQAIGKRIKGGTEAGRAVAAFRNIAKKNMDPAYWLDKAKRQIGDEKDLPTEVVTAINDLIKNKDRIGLARFVSQLGESSTWEKAVGLWKAGLLTSFRTHEANIISNMGMATLETMKELPAVGFDIIRSKLTGTPREKAFGAQVLAEMAKGAKRGTGVAKNIIMDGIDPRDVDKLDIYKPLRFGNTKGGRFAQAYTDAVFRTLGAEDKIFYEAAYGRSLAEQALLETINNKLPAEEASKLISSPTEDMIARAVKTAEEATFTKQNGLSDVIQGAKRNASGLVRAGIELLAPFTKTPSNVAEMVFNYTPAGFVKDTIKKILNGESVSNQQLAESFGRSATGLGLLWAGSQLADIIQGPTPASPSERSQMYLEGRQPNSILINGKWVRVDKISPLGNLLILGAEFKNSGGNLMQTAFEGAKALTEQTFLKGVSSGLQAVNDPENYAGSFVENAAGGVIPTIISDISRGTDQFMREAEGPLERIQSRIPAVRERLPERLDALGNPIAQEENIPQAMFDPFNTSPQSDDPLVQEFSRVGYNLNTVGDKIGGVKLTGAQQREYQRVAGAKIKDIVPQVIASQAYQNATPDQQKSLIEKAVNKAKDIAREDVKRRLDEIKDDKGFTSQAAELSPNYGYEVSTDAPTTLGGKVGLYGKSLITNPFETVGAMANGNPIRKMRGDITVLERKKGLGQIDQGNKETVVDHKIPLSLGGSNRPNNLQQLTETENQQKAKVEVHLIDLVENGDITKKEAQKRVENWREELKNLPSEFPIATPDDVVITGDYSYTDDKGTFKTLNLSKVASMPEDTEYKRLLKQKESYKLVDDILDNLDSAQQESALKELGISRADAEYYDLSKQDTVIRSAFITELAQQTPAKDRTEFLSKLAEMRREVQGKKALTNNIIDDLVDSGQISESEGKMLKNFTYDKDGQPKLKTSGRGKSAKLKKIKFVPLKLRTSKPSTGSASRLKLSESRLGSNVNFPTANIPVNKVQTPSYNVKFNL